MLGNFDIKIQYGDSDTYDEIRTGFTKNGGSFFIEPTQSGEGTHGLLGNGSVDDVFATYCADYGLCEDYGHDYFNFSTSGILPMFSNVTCGFYGTQDGIYAYWKDCEEGDNVQKMTYWIRY